MGKKNRQRRAEKRRAHARRQRGRPEERPRQPPRGADAPPTPPPPPSLDELVRRAARVAFIGGPVLDEAVAALEPGPRLSRALASAMCEAVADAWSNGWQPTDLVHAVGCRLTKAHRPVCADAVGLEARSYRSAAGADPDWLAQLGVVAPEPSNLDADGLCERWGDDGVRAALEVLGLLLRLPSLPRLCPPPRDWGRTSPRTAAGRCDPRITERVRALLAKAESTEFPDEAEAFSVKAQELIARHAIDRAMLHGEATGAVVGRRVLFGDPYIREKGLLLCAVGEANRCRVVLTLRFGFGTVFGLPSHLDAVELLHASLLTQATSAMVAAGNGPGGRDRRTRSFRQSFLWAYAARIGERLEAATASAVDEATAEHGERLLPILAAQGAAVEEAVDAAFPRLRPLRGPNVNAAGYLAGRAAADLAHLGPGAELRSAD